MATTRASSSEVAGVTVCTVTDVELWTVLDESDVVFVVLAADVMVVLVCSWVVVLAMLVVAALDVSRDGLAAADDNDVVVVRLWCTDV